MAASHRGIKPSATTMAPATAGTPSPGLRAHVAQIEESHQRCAALGLTRIERLDYEPLMRGDLSVARERNQRLSTHAAPVMEMLFEQIVDSHSMIVLTDAQGTILHSVGDNDFLERADKIALAPGANWAEHSKGTNAIGTALFAEAPTVVHAGEHFMHAHSFLTCSATPIFDPRGNMLGVLDVSGDHRTYHRHTMGLVRMSARMIENQWLNDDYSNRLRLHFHHRVAYLGTLVEGVVVVGADGKILGANRSALELLGIGGASLRMHSLTSLFGATSASVFDHFRSPLAAPMQLNAPCGSPFFVSARFVWPPRSVVSGAVTWVDATCAEGASEVVEPTDAPRVLDGRPESLTGRVAGASPALRKPAGLGLAQLETGDARVAATVDKVRRVLNRDIPLLILGQTGTGKEVLARAAHHDSSRARQSFVAVNCASIPESLIEAELFGHEEGAFTGARRKGSTGLIVQADGGTLFLDEIGDMPMALQARLLRVLQERCVTPLGGQKSVAVDIAVVAATHRDLRGMIDQNQFREDLYYRLNGLVVRLPALCERSDLAALVKRILTTEAPNRPLQISPSVMALFRRYSWPGNVRQLVNVLRTAAVMAGSELQINEGHLSEDFLEDVQRAAPVRPHASAAPVGARAAAEHETAVPQPVRALVAAAERATPPAFDARFDGEADASTAPAVGLPTALMQPAKTLEEGEVEMIRNALDAARGNISEAAKRLGISRNTIYRKLRWNQP
ncbi:MAG: sigma-54-dependent Fis family transcriptional regulator [Pseudomonadota bacterium]|nr:sigma-54-dependent Fis family transcriptional regulator [Pseudomonadota bacterium]